MLFVACAAAECGYAGAADMGAAAGAQRVGFLCIVDHSYCCNASSTFFSQTVCRLQVLSEVL